jgi:Bacteriophage abortive infection AbiH
MNRVVLLGNGFDLAHGMKTGYVDFIKWYIAQRIKAVAKSDTIDCLLKISPTNDYRAPRPKEEDDIVRYVNLCYENGFNLNRFGEPALDWDGRTYRYPYVFEPQSRILKGLIKHCSIKGWVDVEAIFYETLIEVLDAKITPVKKEEELKMINESMRLITKQLETYLSSLPVAMVNQEYNKILFDYITKDDLESSRKGEEVVVFTNDQGHYVERSRPNETLVLNFNYTNTIEMYVGEDGRRDPDIKLNYIHGKLNSNDNPMVFGFGDEIDKRYPEIENETAQGYFEHIKSFWYLRTSNYKNLVRFVDGEKYQIVILGHSCGLSDRTMLHMLLEHENCKSIKLYYHGAPKENNYTETTYEIARHFHDKSLLRKRIVSLDKSSNMPQPLAKKNVSA